jgi:hypothetical protein
VVANFLPSDDEPSLFFIYFFFIYLFLKEGVEEYNHHPKRRSLDGKRVLIERSKMFYSRSGNRKELSRFISISALNPSNFYLKTIENIFPTLSVSDVNLGGPWDECGVTNTTHTQSHSRCFSLRLGPSVPPLFPHTSKRSGDPPRCWLASKCESINQ